LSHFHFASSIIIKNLDFILGTTFTFDTAEKGCYGWMINQKLVAKDAKCYSGTAKVNGQPSGFGTASWEFRYLWADVQQADWTTVSMAYVFPSKCKKNGACDGASTIGEAEGTGLSQMFFTHDIYTIVDNGEKKYTALTNPRLVNTYDQLGMIQQNNVGSNYMLFRAGEDLANCWTKNIKQTTIVRSLACIDTILQME
jgi:hypothetical protein